MFPVAPAMDMIADPVGRWHIIRWHIDILSLDRFKRTVALRFTSPH
jgi:hypothetical protein